MRKQILVCLCYAIATACVVVVQRSLQSPGTTFSIMNGVLFLSFLAAVVFTCVIAKTASALLFLDRYCDREGVIRSCHSWILFLHYAYNSRLRDFFPFRLSKINFKMVDDGFLATSRELTWFDRSERTVFIIDFSPLEGRLGVATIARAFRSFAGMLSIGVSSAVAAVTMCICMSSRQTMATASCSGLVIGIVSYLAVRLFVVLLNASRDVMIGKYAHARVILWVLLSVFPLGTLFAYRALRLLRDHP